MKGENLRDISPAIYTGVNAAARFSFSNFSNTNAPIANTGCNQPCAQFIGSKKNSVQSHHKKKAGSEAGQCKPHEVKLVEFGRTDGPSCVNYICQLRCELVCERIVGYVVNTFKNDVLITF